GLQASRATAAKGPQKLLLRPVPASAIRVHPSLVRVLNSLMEDMGYGHVDVCTSSPPIVSAEIGLAGREDPAPSGARPDPGLSVSLPGDPRHCGPRRLPLCQRHRNDLPGEN